MKKVILTPDEWKRKLDPETFRVTRENGTEAPFTGKYWNEHAKGMYKCSNCDAELFSSDAKFDSSTGWPSFDKVLPGAVEYKEDTTMGMSRTEVVCARCGAHLGHRFPDGPTATGNRYCINSCALDLQKDEGTAAQ